MADFSIHVHDKPVWHIEDWFGSTDLEFCHCYYHQLKGQIGLHSSEFYELDIVMNGSADHQINDHIYDADSGSIFIIPPGTVHGFQSNQDATIFCGLIRSEFMEKFDRDLQTLPGYTFLFEVVPYLQNEGKNVMPILLTMEQFHQIQPVIEYMIRASSMAYQGRETIKNAEMLLIISMLSSYVERMKGSKKIMEKNPNGLAVSKSMEYIRLNSDLRLTVDQLADKACMSRSTYMRNFTAIAGCTPMQFLLHCRLAHARQMLCCTSLPIGNIALECGFYDTPHFVRSFTKGEGTTPSEYRKLHFHDIEYASCTICQRPVNTRPN